jgi:MFS-type transporter involved in bile tolerance (Atg22 family)
MEQQQEYYKATIIPAEPLDKHPGRADGLMAILCAILSLMFFPPIFGITGIILGKKSRKEGSVNLGLISIILSVVFMIMGIIIGILDYKFGIFDNLVI